ncbi:MAG: PEP-CTERM sorting domain-containing protein [Planctomycetota bacterium]|jgi:hypothetical protein
MKRTLFVLAALLSFGACAGAAVLDGFEGGPAWVNNYTMSSSDGSVLALLSSATGSNGEAPYDGSELGMCIGDGQRVYANIWNGAQVSDGDTVSVAFNVQQDAYHGGALVVKTFDGGSYQIGFCTWGLDAYLNAGVKGLTDGQGHTVRDWTESWSVYLRDADGHSDPIGNFNLGELAGWYVVEGTYAEVDDTNVITATIYDENGAQIASETYTDSGTGAADAQGPGDFGFVVQPWALDVDVDNLVLDAAQGPCVMGDANGDGTVGIADLSALADNYGSTSGTWRKGDFNDDGTVGIADLSALADNYGKTGNPCDPEATIIPEPTTLALLGLSSVAALLRRRR